MKYLILSALLFGCFDPIQLDFTPTEEEQAAQAEAEELVVHPSMVTQGVCGLSFRADEESAPMVQRAVQRWSDATGCEFTFAEDGVVPVIVWDTVYIAQDRATGVKRVSDHWEEDPNTLYYAVCGNTSVAFQTSTGRILGIDIVVSRHQEALCGEGSLEHAITHEVGHAVANRSKWAGTNHVKEKTLMNAGMTGVDAIETPDLTLICSTLECQVFQPEE